MMKRIIVELKRLYIVIQWNFQYFYYFLKKHKIDGKNNFFDNGIKIILAPHSDDEWIGCSEIIKNNQGNVIVYNMNMSGNDNENIHKLRYSELKSTCDRYNCLLLNFNNDLLKIIKKYRPRYIFTPNFIDWHEEHQQVIFYLYETLKKMSKKDLAKIEIAMYQISVPIIPEHVTHYLSLSKNEQKSKWSYFKNNYVSQNYFPYKRFLINERINGLYFNEYSVESYIVKNVQNWMNSFDFFESHKKNIILLKKNINNIKKTRDEVKKVL